MTFLLIRIPFNLSCRAMEVVSIACMGCSHRASIVAGTLLSCVATLLLSTLIRCRDTVAVNFVGHDILLLTTASTCFNTDSRTEWIIVKKHLVSCLFADSVHLPSMMAQFTTLVAM